MAELKGVDWCIEQGISACGAAQSGTGTGKRKRVRAARAATVERRLTQTPRGPALWCPPRGRGCRCLRRWGTFPPIPVRARLAQMGLPSGALEPFDKLYHDARGDGGRRKGKAAAKSAGAPNKTAWAKGTGFGGGSGVASTAGAQKAEKRQLTLDKQIQGAIEELVQPLFDLATLEKPSGEGAAGDLPAWSAVLGALTLLHQSALEELLVLLLRNDSLYDIISSRSGLFCAVFDLLQALVASDAATGLLHGGCPLRLAMRSGEARAAPVGLSPAAKRRRSTKGDALPAGREEPGTPAVELLLNLDAKSKLFIRQCKTTGEADTDPDGIAKRCRMVCGTVRGRVTALPAFLKSAAVLASPTVVDDAHEEAEGGEAAAGAAAPEEGAYLEAMKGLSFRMQKLDFGRHFFSSSIDALNASTVAAARLKRIGREMASLSAGLPLTFGSSIFARVDDRRPDVLTALIIGPEGTPYANGCFVFHIFLPREYPAKPPKVQFVTTGGGTVRFNPNLYREGKVCLSLLGTWQGPGWDPKVSTILQVLLSVQSLILVDEPYFNEPGFESRPNAKEQSAAYNQALNLHTMRIAILQMLQEDFHPEMRAVIRNHFLYKRKQIIQQCDEWAAKAQPPAKLLSSPAAYGYMARLHELTPSVPAELRQAADLVRAALNSISMPSAAVVLDD